MKRCNVVTVKGLFQHKKVVDLEIKHRNGASVSGIYLYLETKKRAAVKMLRHLQDGHLLVINLTSTRITAKKLFVDTLFDSSIVLNVRFMFMNNTEELVPYVLNRARTSKRVVHFGIDVSLLTRHFISEIKDALCGNSSVQSFEYHHNTTAQSFPNEFVDMLREKRNKVVRDRPSL